MSGRRLDLLLLGAVLTAACREARSSLLVLDHRDTVLSRHFQQVSNVVELTDGRVALAEIKDKTFLIADFGTDAVTLIGEHADTIRPNDPAPGKHKLPGFVVHLAGDTLALVDFAAERTTLWNERGEYLAVLGGRGVGGSNQAAAFDNLGNAYKEDVRTVLGGLEPGQELSFDSLSVLRQSRGDTVADTVAKLKLPPWGRGQFGEQTKIVSTIFAGRDLFGVLPDGALWVARASNNAVDWRAPDGTWRRGPGRSYQPVTVTQAERDYFLERLRQQMALMGAPAGIELSYPFADQKGPFVAGVTNQVGGEVWLQRPRPFPDSVPIWDVVGRDGRDRRAVQLPKGATIGGFGAAGRLYLILREEGGWQQVARYALPEDAARR